MTTGLTPAGPLNARLRADERKALAFCDWALGSTERGSETAHAWLAQWHAMDALNSQAKAPSRGMLWRPLLNRLPGQAPALEEAKPEFADLASLPMPSRIAVLLVLLGLSPEDSAEAMRLSAHAHAEQLGAGLPRLADGAVDAVRWQAWSQALAAYVAAIPVARTAALFQARFGSHPEPAAASDATTDAARLTRRNLALVGVACATLLALTFVPGVRERIDHPDVKVDTRLLEDVPAANAGSAAGPAVELPPLDPVVENLAFYAWYASQRLHERPATVLEPLVSEPASQLPESDDAP